MDHKRPEQYLTNGEFDFLKFRRACVKYARLSGEFKRKVRLDGYEDDFAQFCAEEYLNTGFWGFRTLVGRFFQKEFIQSDFKTPKSKAKRNAVHAEVGLLGNILVDERTVEMIKDFESRCAIPNKNGIVKSDLWCAFQRAIAEGRKKLRSKLAQRSLRGEKQKAREPAKYHPTTWGSKHYRAKINEVQVREIRRRAELGESLAHLGRFYALAPNSIWNIVNKKSWRHV